MASGWMTRGSVPSRIRDVLEMDGWWMSADALCADLSMRFDTVKLTNVRRAMQRLRDKDRVEVRFVEVYTQRILDDGHKKQMEVRYGDGTSR